MSHFRKRLLFYIAAIIPETEKKRKKQTASLFVWKSVQEGFRSRIKQWVATGGNTGKNNFENILAVLFSERALASNQENDEVMTGVRCRFYRCLAPVLFDF